MSLTGATSRRHGDAARPPQGYRPPFPRWVADLAGYRKLLQDAWTNETVHESFIGPAGADVPSSRGQCGVSSAWLVETLAGHQVPNLSYCYGDVYSALEPERIEVELHCWIEVGYERHRLVVDLTGDQAEILRQHQVLYGWHDELASQHHVDYRPRKRLTPRQLKSDRVQARLAILKTYLPVIS
ncbi:hypothetical protein [Kribbella sp. NPDC051718]|uniref:hypothetical protein n=1 Tax=Kribbella sp. NPDC051718 TaxID=3155168 RepID=UPI003440F2E1